MKTVQGAWWACESAGEGAKRRVGGACRACSARNQTTEQLAAQASPPSRAHHGLADAAQAHHAQHAAAEGAQPAAADDHGIRLLGGRVIRDGPAYVAG